MLVLSVHRLYGRGVVFSADNMTYDSSAGTLYYLDQEGDQGTDARLGSWDETSYEWMTESNRSHFRTSIRVYSHITLPTGGGAISGMVVFTQVYIGENDRIGQGNISHVSSSFPQFNTSHHPEIVEQGYFQYNTNKDPHIWNSAAYPSPPALGSGHAVGPIVIFDRGNSSVRQVASIISPYSNFMEASMVQDKAGQLHIGLMDSYPTVPSGYTLETMVYIQGNGVTQMMEHWVSIGPLTHPAHHCSAVFPHTTSPLASMCVALSVCVRVM